MTTNPTTQAEIMEKLKKLPEFVEQGDAMFSINIAQAQIDALKIFADLRRLALWQQATIEKKDEALKKMRDCDVPFENDNSKFFECREEAQQALQPIPFPLEDD